DVFLEFIFGLIQSLFKIAPQVAQPPQVELGAQLGEVGKHSLRHSKSNIFARRLLQLYRNAAGLERLAFREFQAADQLRTERTEQTDGLLTVRPLVDARHVGDGLEAAV